MALPQPADSELAILRVLWRHGRATARTVHEELLPERMSVSTTVLKTLQIMFEKGLVTRDETSKSHIYFPAVEEEATTARLLQDLADKAFGGSGHRLLMHALHGARSSAEELDTIQALLEANRKERG